MKTAKLTKLHLIILAINSELKRGGGSDHVSQKWINHNFQLIVCDSQFLVGHYEVTFQDNKNCILSLSNQLCMCRKAFSSSENMEIHKSEKDVN